MRRLTLALSAFLALALFAAACSSDSDDSSFTGEATEEAQATAEPDTPVVTEPPTPPPTEPPTAPPTAPPTSPPAQPPVQTGGGDNCSPSYPTVCIPPPPPDLDCGDISYRRFTVLPPDPHGFDGNDNDGVGCESG